MKCGNTIRIDLANLDYESESKQSYFSSPDMRNTPFHIATIFFAILNLLKVFAVVSGGD